MSVYSISGRRHATRALVSILCLAAVMGCGDSPGAAPAETLATSTSILDLSVTTSTTPVMPVETTIVAPLVNPSTTTSSTLVPPDGLGSDERRLVEVNSFAGDDLQPKSIVVGPGGLVFTQNMMYRHNVTVFDRSGAMVAVVSDRIDLADYGLADESTLLSGSPVEAAVSPDGQSVWVSNYKMYGPGYTSNADDECGAGNWEDSFVYRIDIATFTIDAVVPTGAVPKFLNVSPDGSRLVVANWCGFDASIIDTERLVEIGRVPLGRHPRGVAITSDSRFAFVTVMGAERIDQIDLATLKVVRSLPGAGITPRHIVLSPDESVLYSSNHLMDTVRSIDVESGELIATVRTGGQPRSMAMADDGRSLYVVNYLDGTFSKVRTSDMTVVQTKTIGGRPIGVSYDPATRRVWVADYSGTIHVFEDQAPEV